MTTQDNQKPSIRLVRTDFKFLDYWSFDWQDLFSIYNFRQRFDLEFIPQISINLYPENDTLYIVQKIEGRLEIYSHKSMKITREDFLREYQSLGLGSAHDVFEVVCSGLETMKAIRHNGLDDYLKNYFTRGESYNDTPYSASSRQRVNLEGLCKLLEDWKWKNLIASKRIRPELKKSRAVATRFLRKTKSYRNEVKAAFENLEFKVDFYYSLPKKAVKICKRDPEDLADTPFSEDDAFWYFDTVLKTIEESAEAAIKKIKLIKGPTPKTGLDDLLGLLLKYGLEIGIVGRNPKRVINRQLFKEYVLSTFEIAGITEYTKGNIERGITQTVKKYKAGKLS